MSTFMKIFETAQGMEKFLSRNNINCIKFDVMDGKVMALFERTAEVMLISYDGDIFYEGDNDYWDIARAIENQIIDEDRAILMEEYNLDLEADIQIMRVDFVTEHAVTGTYDINNITDRDVDNLLIKDLSDARTVMWNDRNEEYYHDLRRLFEV